MPSDKQAAKRDKLVLTATVVAIVGAWLGVATWYYAKYEAWPYAQAFFYAVDTGMSLSLIHI